jgi:hypothetical protein
MGAKTIVMSAWTSSKAAKLRITLNQETNSTPVPVG